MDVGDDVTQLSLLPFSYILLLRRLGLLTSPKRLSLEFGGLINSSKSWNLEIEGVEQWGNGKVMELEIEGMKLEEVSKTKYLGTTVTKDNLTEEQIKERIAAGNRGSFANQKILQSKLISKKTKMKLYKAPVGPVAVYVSECWVLTENIKQKLLVFERKILRRIEWRLKTNEELEKAINNENIVSYIKYKRLSWLGACRKNDQ